MHTCSCPNKAYRSHSISFRYRKFQLLMAMEVKVYFRKKTRGKTKQIDHIPKCFQLPRSASASKPRTQFYLPICSFKEIELDPHSSKEIQSVVTVGCLDVSPDSVRGTLDPSSSRSTEPQHRRRKTPKNSKPLPVTDVELFRQKAHIQPCSNRYDEERDDTMEVTPNRLQLTDSSEICTTRGSVVWAKADGRFWWPAEVLGERSDQAPSVLVRYFGKHDSVWVDPAIDVSPFEECFEERRCNQAKEFQNALKQALHYNKHRRLYKDFSGSPEVADGVNHLDQLHERGNSSSPSRAGTDCTGRARSKRERKRKVHFDEVSCPLYTSRKVRRFKIMRSLGLAAPVGSPFNSSS